MLQAPLHAHEEHAAIAVNVLLEVLDVPLVGEDKPGHVVNEPRLVRAVNEERGSVWHARTLAAPGAVFNASFSAGLRGNAR